MAKDVDRVEEDASGEGHNSEAQTQLIRKYAKQIVDARAGIQAAQKALGRIRKNAKADGLTLGRLDAVIALMESTPDEQRVFFSELHEYAEALYVAHVPVGNQLDLLANTGDPEVRSRDAFARGFAAATTGKGVFCEPPPEIAEEDRNEWIRGWHEGQVVNAPAQLEEA